MMEEDLTNDQEPVQPSFKRPSGLTVICVLTFIFSGISLISFLYCSLNYQLLPEQLKASPFSKDVPGIEVFAQASIWFFILNFLLNAASLTGAILMFKMRKVGFHFYTIAQIMLLIIPLIYLPGYHTEVINIMITAVFILIYAANLRLMR